MKILFICSREFDYAQDLAYEGLCHILGKSSVRDYPWKKQYHLSLKEYPKNLGYTGFSLPVRLPVNFKSFDLVVLAAAKPDALHTYASMLPQLKNKPAILIDGGDDARTGGDFYRLGAGDVYEEVIRKKPFDVILKREYLPAVHEADEHIYPFPFSFPHHILLDTVPGDQKKYEVSFWGQQSPIIRENALKLLAGKYDCDRNGTILNQHFGTYKRKGRFYLEELAACKIVLNFRGGGWDTMRYWETPAAGSFMISQQPRIRIPDNFIAGEQVAWCSDSLDDLLEKIDYYLARPVEREQMAAKAKEHLYTYHLNTVRAARLLEIVQQQKLV